MRIRCIDIENKASERPAGYKEELYSLGTIVDDYLEISPENYHRMMVKYSPNTNITHTCSSCNNKDMPSMMTMANELGKSIVAVGKDLINNKNVFAIEEIINKRLNICKSCEFFNNENNRCSICGCYMTAKTKLNSSNCPKGLW